MLSFPDDRAIEIIPILGKSDKPYIVATAAYFHDAYTGRRRRGGGGEREGIERDDIPAEKLYFTLEKLRFMYPMYEVTVFGFAHVPLVDFLVPISRNAAGSWSA